MSGCFNAALKYAARGWPVFPLWGSDGKKPITKHGVDDATTNPDIITEWWERWPYANVGIACGQKSFDVIDIDSAKGESALVAWLEERGIFDEAKAVLNGTPINLTSKGKHLLFQPAGKLKNVVRAAEDVDIRTDGGYIVAPPSVHRESGKVYQWAEGRSPEDMKLAPFPDWLIDYLKTGTSGRGSASLISDTVITIHDGARNDTLFRQAASARSRGLGAPAITAMLHAVNSTQCVPPRPADEVERIVESAVSYPPGGSRDAIGGEEEETGIALRDICTIQVVNAGKDNEREDMTFSPDLAADALINIFDIVSTPDEKIWVYQNGFYDPKGDVILCQVLDRVAGDLASTRNNRETMNKIFLRTLDDYSVFDPDPCLFGVLNGVIDMRTGQFSPHDPKHKLTQVAPVVYDPSATCPETMQFLTTCLGPHDVKTLLQIFAAKTTRLVFEYFSPWIGRGQNGKTKTEDLIRAFWGDDATTEVEIAGLGRNRFDMVELRGKRWLINSEVSGGAKESRWIKIISGGGKLTADQKGREHLEFRANCFIIFDCNNPPKFSDNTHGFNRRIVPIIWPVSFVDDPKLPHERARDPNILDKITTQKELSGLLNVLIKIAPEIIRTKTIYRKDDGDVAAKDYDLRSTTIESFWERFTEIDEGENFSSKTMYLKYCLFCESIGATAKRDRDFNEYARNVLKLKKGRAATDEGYINSWRGVTFDSDAFNEFLVDYAGSLTTTGILPASNRHKPIRGPAIPSRPAENVFTIWEELEEIFSIKGIQNYAGHAGHAGPDSDSSRIDAGQNDRDMPSQISQILADHIRKGIPIRTREYPDIGELEMLEALDAGGWTEKRGVWWPPSEETR